MTIQLPRTLADALIEHAREGQPNEVCGLVAMQDDRIARLERAHNGAENPRVRFEFTRFEDFKRMMDWEDEGFQVGFYHSHPASPAYPSRTDIALVGANYPGYLQLMVSLRFDPAPGPELHAYRIEDETVTTMELELVDD